jgi:hypothetical protein
MMRNGRHRLATVEPLAQQHVCQRRLFARLAEACTAVAMDPAAAAHFTNAVQRELRRQPTLLAAMAQPDPDVTALTALLLSLLTTQIPDAPTRLRLQAALCAACAREASGQP